MNFKSKQSLFDFVARHLLLQGKKSFGDSTVNCLYRGLRGLKCAVGCVIPDKMYTSRMEGKTVDNLINLSALTGYKLPWYINRYRKFLKELQIIHDYVSISRWKDVLIELGQKHNLDVSQVKKMKLRED